MTQTSTATAPASVSRRWTHRMSPLSPYLYAQTALSIIGVTEMSAWVSLVLNSYQRDWHVTLGLFGDNSTNFTWFYLLIRYETSESFKNSEVCGK